MLLHDRLLPCRLSAALDLDEMPHLVTHAAHRGIIRQLDRLVEPTEPQGADRRFLIVSVADGALHIRDAHGLLARCCHLPAPMPSRRRCSPLPRPVPCY